MSQKLLTVRPIPLRQVNAGALVRAVLDVVDATLDAEDVPKQDFDRAIVTILEFSKTSGSVDTSPRAAALYAIAKALTRLRIDA